MPRLKPYQRHQMVKMVRAGVQKKLVAELFGVSRETVRKWCKRANHRGSESFRDKPRRPKKAKITEEVVFSIVELRTKFGWGTERIKRALLNIPEFMRGVLAACVQGVRLSRTAIDGILRAFGLNGYRKNERAWKFFRAERPDELWQFDIKGPVWIFGQKYWFPVCVDDYSRYLLLLERLDHEPTTDELVGLLDGCHRRPKNILTDHGGQFKETWKQRCRERGIEPLYAHPHYPQDKGKVERAIRNVAEEFVNLTRRFSGWLGKEQEYRQWYNHSRPHLGVGTQPANLYPALV